MASPSTPGPTRSHSSMNGKPRRNGVAASPLLPPVSQQMDQNVDPVRTTVVLPAEVYWNLSAWCVKHQLRKGDGIVELLKAGLTQQGLDPSKIPNIKFV